MRCSATPRAATEKDAVADWLAGLGWLAELGMLAGLGGLGRQVGSTAPSSVAGAACAPCRGPTGPPPMVASSFFSAVVAPVIGSSPAGVASPRSMGPTEGCTEG